MEICSHCGTKGVKSDDENRNDKRPLFVKNGYKNGRQRYKCRSCGYQFTNKLLNDFSIAHKRIAISLYHAGVSPQEISELFGFYSYTTIYRWVKKDVCGGTLNDTEVEWFLDKIKTLPNRKLTLEQINEILSEYDQISHLLN